MLSIALQQQTGCCYRPCNHAHNSASSFGERFFVKPRVQKRRIGEKDPPITADD